MGNEAKTIASLNAANDEVKRLRKENRELKEMLVYCKHEMDRMKKKIGRYEKSLLSAVTTLDWKEWEI